MLVKLNQIILFSLVAVGISFVLYPLFIKLLKVKKIGQSIRDDDATGNKSEIFNKLHKHKGGTPTMGGAMFLIVVGIMVGLSILIQHLDLGIKFSLLNRKETYLLLFGLFSMGIIGVIDDYMNIKGIGAKKGMSARTKMLGIMIFAGFISWWFYAKLGVDYLRLRPIIDERHIGIFFPFVSFFLIIAITNAINIVDGLDGLAGGLMSFVLIGLGGFAFFTQHYIMTTLVAVVLSVLLVFMFFNIFPAKIFMGDSGALGLGGFLGVLLLMLNMQIGIIVPFTVLFILFIIDTFTSSTQLLSKKILKKKLYKIAPFHHYLEHKGMHETTIVMQAWFIQLVLLTLFIVLMSLQIFSSGFILS